jgi:DNA-binding transcriptional MerR regulator/methylmalonyl-CoA mutase cobalamin-binding subunit
MSTEPRYRIGAVARLTGVSTHALRVWERRYATVSPTRSEGGDRLYSEADVQRLRRIKRLLGMGHAIGELATLPDMELERILELHAGARQSVVPGTGTVDRYLSHIERMDIASAEQVLAGAALALDRRDFMQQVLTPLMVEVGRRWAHGGLGPSQEHAASAMVRTHLGSLLRLFAPDSSAPTVLCTTPAGELHELGALLAAVTAALSGWRSIYLGPDLPAPEIARAARVSGAELVLLSVISLDPERVRSELSALVTGLGPHCRVLVGGSGARKISELPERVERIAELTELEDWLSRRIGNRLTG